MVENTRVIKVPAPLFARLESHAQGFDTPAGVIERLLDAYEGVEERAESVQENKAYETRPRKKDRTKYTFNGDVLGKGRLVLAVVKAHVAANPRTSSRELEAAFPKELQGSLGVFGSLEEADEILSRTGHARHFLKSHELIRLVDGFTAAVCTEWGAGNIERFVGRAQELGYEIDARAA